MDLADMACGYFCDAWARETLAGRVLDAFVNSSGVLEMSLIFFLGGGGGGDDGEVC